MLKMTLSIDCLLLWHITVFLLFIFSDTATNKFFVFASAKNSLCNYF